MGLPGIKATLTCPYCSHVWDGHLPLPTRDYGNELCLDRDAVIHGCRKCEEPFVVVTTIEVTAKVHAIPK